jgi:hypothetical protein
MLPERQTVMAQQYFGSRGYPGHNLEAMLNVPTSNAICVVCDANTGMITAVIRNLHTPISNSLLKTLIDGTLKSHVEISPSSYPFNLHLALLIAAWQNVRKNFESPEIFVNHEV